MERTVSTLVSFDMASYCMLVENLKTRTLASYLLAREGNHHTIRKCLVRANNFWETSLRGSMV